MAEELADIEDWLCMESEEWRLWLDIEEEGFCLTWLATTRLFKAATTGTKVKAWSRRGLRGAWVKFCQRESLCQHFTSSYYPTVTDLFWVRYWDFIFFFFLSGGWESVMKSQRMRCSWMEQVQNTVSVYQLEGLKDWSGPAWHWGSSGERLFGGCSYKSFHRIRVFESGRDLGVKELHVQSSANNTRAFLPLRMWSSTWLEGHRGTGVKTVTKWFF